MFKYIVLGLFLCFCLTACAFDLKHVAVSYEGYSLPKDESVWLENTEGKIKIMVGEQRFWGGYFYSGEVFTIIAVKNNKRVKILGTLFVGSNDKITIACNKQLTACKE